VYLQIIAGNEKPPLGVLLRNLPTLLKVRLTASSRIRALAARALERHYDPDSSYIGKWELILGLLCKYRKKSDLAAQHLTKAKDILARYGQTPILARVETALAELGK
jgi:hypothetical protein